MSFGKKLALSEHAARPVIDASPLIHLARAGRVPLLRNLFGTVVVPESVVAEVLKDEADSTAAQLATHAWLHVVAVEIPPQPWQRSSLRFVRTAW